jgi:hypothetical protein
MVTIGKKAEGTPDAELIQMEAPPADEETLPHSFPWLLDQGNDDAISEMLDSVAAAAGFLPLSVEEVLVSWRKFRPAKEAA